MKGQPAGGLYLVARGLLVEDDDGDREQPPSRAWFGPGSLGGVEEWAGRRAPANRLLRAFGETTLLRVREIPPVLRELVKV